MKLKYDVDKAIINYERLQKGQELIDFYLDFMIFP